MTFKRDSAFTPSDEEAQVYSEIRQQARESHQSAQKLARVTKDERLVRLAELTEEIETSLSNQEWEYTLGLVREARNICDEFS